MLLLDMAYRLLREFRQAFTRLDTPPFSNRRHPGSDIAQRGAQPGLRVSSITWASLLEADPPRAWPAD